MVWITIRLPRSLGTVSSTSLGMPGLPPVTRDPAWKNAWDSALYGPDGFFRRESPVAHFRTSVHASPLFAEALVRLAHQAGLDTIVDIGAGRGELLEQVHLIDPSLLLLGVEVAARPEGLAPAIDWTPRLPASVDGLIVANEWLDNTPCHVVEVDDSGTTRIVHVDPATGMESLGLAVSDDEVPRSVAAWLSSWWPLDPRESGVRAEIGTARDAAWADVVRRVHRGIAIAIDYGHTAAERPSFGTLRSYLDGSEVDVLPDGSRDVTAHVAVDSVAAQVAGHVVTQREALRALGVDGSRPDLDLAETDPTGYVMALARCTEAAELTAVGGIGDFRWVISTSGGVESPLG